jgi:hypothetical protein
MGLQIKTQNKTDNSNYDCSNNEYKIYKITNMISGLYYISYSRSKYLSRVKEDLLRKPTETFKLLFNGIDDKNDIMIELLTIVIADNIYFVKQHIKLIEKDDKVIIKNCDKPINRSDCDEPYTPYNIDHIDTIKEPKKETKSLNTIKENKKIEKTKEPKKCYVYDDKICEKCNQSFTYKNFSRHSKKCSN